MVPACAQALVAHCQAWIGKFNTLLTNLAMRELAELQEHLRASSAVLTQLATSEFEQVGLSSRIS